MIHDTRCKMCTKVEEKDKLLCFKLDYLTKHVGKKKYQLESLECKWGNFCIANRTNIARTRFYMHILSGFLSFIRKLLERLLIIDRRWSNLLLFYRSSRRTSLELIVRVFKIFSSEQKILQTNIGMINGWKMEKCMNFWVLQMTKEVVKASQYISMSCNFNWWPKLGIYSCLLHTKFPKFSYCAHIKEVYKGCNYWYFEREW